MAMKPVRIEHDQNPIYPLPEDYFELTNDGQRLARVNALRQWQLTPRSLEDKGNLYLGSLRFFDAYYLCPDEAADFNPYFYPKDPFPTPQYHELISTEGAKHRMLVAIAPRGGAKSMLAAKNMLLRLTTRPSYRYVYCTSTQDNAARMAETVRAQLQTNARLINDLGPLVPKRGEATFSANLMYLTNRSWIQYVSIDSRLRGLRPDCFQIDDPEWDPKASTSMVVVREQMDRMLFSVILPTVMEEDASVLWYATFVSKQHYAWLAAGTDSAGEPLDARFQHWYRIVAKAVEEDPETGELMSCWPEKWPATEKKRLEMAKQDARYYDTVSLEHIQSVMGPRVWQSEYMANPGQGEELAFGQTSVEEHGYWYVPETIDGFEETKPYESRTQVAWHDQEQNLQTIEMRDLCKQFRLFMCVDTSYTSGPASDFKCAALMAHGPRNTLFVMDLWEGQCDQKVLERVIWQMADKWHCPLVGVEYIHSGIALYNALNQALRTRSQEMAGTSWLPRLFKIKPGVVEKTAKIAGALAMRFEHGLIKLPWFRQARRPWRSLFSQIQEFNPDARNGGLQNDDCIDTVAMHQFIVGGKIRMPALPKPEPVTATDYLAEGKEDIHGVPIGSSIDWRTIPVALVEQLMRDRHGPEPRGGESKV